MGKIQLVIASLTLEKNIKWRGFEFFHGKNSTGYCFSQIDSAFYYTSEYTKEEFSDNVRKIAHI